MFIALSVLAVAVALLLLGARATRAGVESAPYEVVRATGAFEVRDYPALKVVETPMSVAGRGADGSFNRLFRFITGGNSARQKIAMTTPVLMSRGDAQATMAFVLPARLATGEVPRPTDGLVTVRELDAGRFAVLRFSGGRNAMNEAEALDRLTRWMAAEQLRVSSTPVYGYFDPPWTPAFLRRNEVMLRTEAGR
jgi:hypothetical protein